MLLRIEWVHNLVLLLDLVSPWVLSHLKLHSAWNFDTAHSMKIITNHQVMPFIFITVSFKPFYLSLFHSSKILIYFTELVCFMSVDQHLCYYPFSITTLIFEITLQGATSCIPTIRWRCSSTILTARDLLCYYVNKIVMWLKK